MITAPPTALEEATRRIIVALDVATADRAVALADVLRGSVGTVKVGLQLFCSAGPAVVRALRDDGHDVFLDLKLADIPATVGAAARVVADLDARFLTVNAPPSSVRAARDELAGSATRLLGITVLTSVSEDELHAWLGTERTVAETVLRRGEALLEAGCDGLVASVAEVEALRREFPEALLVTPGIRPPGAAAGDQARVATPEAAAASGADHLVVGRPIRDAPDPVAAARAIAEDAWRGFERRA